MNEIFGLLRVFGLYPCERCGQKIKHMNLLENRVDEKVFSINNLDYINAKKSTQSIILNDVKPYKLVLKLHLADLLMNKKQFILFLDEK